MQSKCPRCGRVQPLTTIMRQRFSKGTTCSICDTEFLLERGEDAVVEGEIVDEIQLKARTETAYSEAESCLDSESDNNENDQPPRNPRLSKDSYIVEYLPLTAPKNAVSKSNAVTRAPELISETQQEQQSIRCVVSGKSAKSTGARNPYRAVINELTRDVSSDERWAVVLLEQEEQRFISGLEVNASSSMSEVSKNRLLGILKTQSVRAQNETVDWKLAMHDAGIQETWVLDLFEPHERAAMAKELIADRRGAPAFVAY